MINAMGSNIFFCKIFFYGEATRYMVKSGDEI